MSLSLGLRFSTDRFDCTTPLPEHTFGGNRFYGRDVAAFLANGLQQRGIGAEYIDEDSGWQVFNTEESDRSFVIEIHNLSSLLRISHSGDQEWGLRVRCFELRKIFRWFLKKVEVPVPQLLASAIHNVFNQEAISLEPWEDLQSPKSRS